ncbi:MAG: SpoIIE family protein phosphatase, partial [Candidatus Eremiobacteraeota bacterium]|nr:SpoIIE family protein phosphatase [Candidatus Eremiobacteraeota bacterium]
MTWSALPDGSLDYIGHGFSETRGRAQDAALGSGWLDGVHPDDRERTHDLWRTAVATGEKYDTQFRVRMADGTYRWQLVRALPIRDEGGAITRWVGVNIDIDEQRRADEGREMFVALAENSSDFIGIGDNDGNAVYVNEAGRRLLEIGSMEAARATSLMDYFRPEDREYVRTHIMAALERDGRWIGDFRFRNFRTGAPVPVAYNFFRLTDAQGKPIGIATVSRDRRERERVDDGLRLLSRTGAATLDSLDANATLRAIARAVVGEFAAICVIDVLDAEGKWERVALAHRDVHRERILEATRHMSQPVPEHPIARALHEGRSSVVTVDAGWVSRVERTPERIDATRSLAVRSIITVPVITPSGKILGALTCVRDAADPRDDYREGDLGFVEEVGRRAGAAIANAQLYERERRIAVELQAASLPAALPRVPGLDLDADYRPGSDEATIGGDWYDAFVLDDGRVAITVGDVLGHGLHAAVTMTKLRQAMQSAAMVDPDPNVMLDVADKTLRLVDRDGYATALAAIYDGTAQTITFASAGHAGPAVRTADGRVEDFHSEGQMLGLRPGGEGATNVVPAVPGVVMVFYTDGLTEATRDTDEGQRRLHEALGRDDVAHGERPARTIVQQVLGTTQASD